jgi:hypothetical protein
MNNKEFISYEQSQALSELNYDGDYDFVYHATGELWERGKKDKKERFLPAPLRQQVLRWFIERYGILQLIEVWEVEDDSTYEEAEDRAISKLIELNKEKDNLNKCLACNEDKGNNELYCSFCRNQN